MNHLVWCNGDLSSSKQYSSYSNNSSTEGTKLRSIPQGTISDPVQFCLVNILCHSCFQMIQNCFWATETSVSIYQMHYAFEHINTSIYFHNRMLEPIMLNSTHVVFSIRKAAQFLGHSLGKVPNDHVRRRKILSICETLNISVRF